MVGEWGQIKILGEWGQIKISSMRAPLWMREAGGGGALEGGPANWELEMVLTLVQKARAATKCRAHSGRLPADSRLRSVLASHGQAASACGSA